MIGAVLPDRDFRLVGIFVLLFVHQVHQIPLVHERTGFLRPAFAGRMAHHDNAGIGKQADMRRHRPVGHPQMSRQFV